MMEENKSALAFLTEVSGRKKLYILWLLIVQAVLGLSSVLYAVLLRNVIDAACAGDKSVFLKFVAFFAGLVAFQIALRAVIRFLEEFSRSIYENLFKERLFTALLTRDYRSVTATHSGEWMNRLTSDTVVVAEGLATIVPGIAGMLVRMLGALGMILYLEPKFAYILIPGGALMVVFTYAFRKILKKLHKKMQEQDGKVRTFLQEHLGSLMVVRAFGVEADSVSEANKRMSDHKKARMKKNHFSNICNIGFGAAMHGAYVIGLAYCGYGLLMGTMSYGTLMAVLQLISQIQNPFANITGYLPKYYAMIASAERLMEAETFATDAANLMEKEKIAGNVKAASTGTVNSISGGRTSDFSGIRMEQVCFSYEDNRQVLTEFSLDVKKGGFVAFTGPSGCGKSTVLKLLLGLYQPDAGEITPVCRSLYAYVPQGNFLMSDTIRNVVAFSEKSARCDEERLQEAIKIACAEFVYELPEGLDTLLGERGLGLSEGQMQRLAIARAIFADRPVLILDEATSALDEETEEALLARLRSMTDKTVIIVTHRPAALKVCDKNIVFNGVRMK